MCVSIITVLWSVYSIYIWIIFISATFYIAVFDLYHVVYILPADITPTRNICTIILHTIFWLDRLNIHIRLIEHQESHLQNIIAYDVGIWQQSRGEINCNMILTSNRLQI